MKKNYSTPHTIIVDLNTSTLLAGDVITEGSDTEPAANRMNLNVEDEGNPGKQGSSLWDE